MLLTGVISPSLKRFRYCSELSASNAFCGGSTKHRRDRRTGKSVFEKVRRVCVIPPVMIHCGRMDDRPRRYPSDTRTSSGR